MLSFLTFIKIRDIGTDKPLGVNAVGEVVFKGPLSMLGYFNNEQANKDTFDKDGWLRSGAIGYKDGFLFLVDRIKELIKVKGMQVKL